MPKRQSGIGLALLLLLGGCTGNSAGRTDTNTRSGVARPAVGPNVSSRARNAATAEPSTTVDQGPTDPGSRTLPVGQPMGQIPVETPPIPMPPVATTP